MKEAFNNETAKSVMTSALTDEIREMKANLTDINQRLTNTQGHCSSQLTIDELSVNISRQGEELSNNTVAVVANSAKLANITVDISTLIRNMSLDRAAVTQLRQKIGNFTFFHESRMQWGNATLIECIETKLKLGLISEKLTTSKKSQLQANFDMSNLLISKTPLVSK